MLKPIDPEYRAWVNARLAEDWGAPMVVSRGRLTDTREIPGFVWAEGAEILGAVTYCIRGSACEIVTLDSYAPGRGIGTALIEAVKRAARAQGCTRLWLITINDNAHAIRFYQMKGFDIAAVHLNAMEEARKRKPGIPPTGMDGIPLRHEIEFAMDL